MEMEINQSRMIKNKRLSSIVSPIKHSLIYPTQQELNFISQSVCNDLEEIPNSKTSVLSKLNIVSRWIEFIFNSNKIYQNVSGLSSFIPMKDAFRTVSPKINRLFLDQTNYTFINQNEKRASFNQLLNYDLWLGDFEKSNLNWWITWLNWIKLNNLIVGNNVVVSKNQIQDIIDTLSKTKMGGNLSKTMGCFVMELDDSLIDITRYILEKEIQSNDERITKTTLSCLMQPVTDAIREFQEKQRKIPFSTEMDWMLLGRILNSDFRTKIVYPAILDKQRIMDKERERKGTFPSEYDTGIPEFESLDWINYLQPSDTLYEYFLQAILIFYFYVKDKNDLMMDFYFLWWMNDINKKYPKTIPNAITVAVKLGIDKPEFERYVLSQSLKVALKNHDLSQELESPQNHEWLFYILSSIYIPREIDRDFCSKVCNTGLFGESKKKPLNPDEDEYHLILLMKLILLWKDSEFEIPCNESKNQKQNNIFCFIVKAKDSIFKGQVGSFLDSLDFLNEQDAYKDDSF